MSNRTPSAHSLRESIRAASEGLVEREALIDILVLAAVAGEHVLVIGPPGTAKSEAVRRVAATLGGRYFEYLLGRFTEPSEIFGPVNLAKLREGTVQTDTTGMLPEAEIAFLDEVFQGSTAILNTLLGLLNERVFLRGHTRMRVPLRLCVAASNALPVDESLSAFADRFLLRAFVEPVSDPMLEQLLTSGWALAAKPIEPAAGLTIAALDELSAASKRVDLSGCVALMAEAVRRLRKGGVFLSDRRLVRAQRLIAAAAAIDGRSAATPADLWPLVYVMPSNEAQVTARALLETLLNHGDNGILQAATDEAAKSALIRSRRLIDFASALAPRAANVSELAREEPWRLKAEALLRDMDASFDESSRTPELASARDRLSQALTAWRQ